MMKSREEGAVSVPDHVLVERLPDDDSVFLNLLTEEYFGLDPVGTAMWRALTETGRVELALDRLLHEFEVEPETLKRDLQSFVEELSKRGLLRVGDDPAGTRPPAHGG